VCLVEVFAHATCVFVCRGDCETHICVCVSTDGAKMTQSTGVCSTILWVLNTTDLCQKARHRATVCLVRTAMEQSGLTRWNVAELAVLYTLYCRAVERTLHSSGRFVRAVFVRADAQFVRTLGSCGRFVRADAQFVRTLGSNRRSVRADVRFVRTLRSSGRLVRADVDIWGA